MAKEKITFEQFFETVSPENKPFVQEMHDYLLATGCKVAFELKKNGYLASYKYGKPPRATLNFIFRPHGMLTRIYGEKVGGYPDFLDTLPAAMVESIGKSGDCAQLISGGCSPKCNGYDFTVKDEHFQKCRYSCFEFLMTEESKPYIKSFIENELQARMAVA